MIHLGTGETSEDQIWALLVYINEMDVVAMANPCSWTYIQANQAMAVFLFWHLYAVSTGNQCCTLPKRSLECRKGLGLPELVVQGKVGLYLGNQIAG